MKKAIVVAPLILLFTLTHAQKDTLKSTAKDWGIVLNLNGLINNITLTNALDVNNNAMVFAKHHLTNQEVLRLGIGINTIRDKWSSTDSITLNSGNRAEYQLDSLEKRSNFSLAVGVEKHLGNSRRLDPFVGAEMIIGRIGKTKIDVNSTTTDATGTAKSQKIIQQDGGFSFGLRLLTGFNFFITEKMSLGAEINFGYLYETSGGDISESTVDTPVSGAQSTSFVKSNAVSSSGGLLHSSSGLLFSYFF